MNTIENLIDNGIGMTNAEKKFGTSEPTVRYRMEKMGMTFEEALKTPKLTDGRPRKEV